MPKFYGGELVCRVEDGQLFKQELLYTIPVSSTLLEKYKMAGKILNIG
jgi:hypothetical protein